MAAALVAITVRSEQRQPGIMAPGGGGGLVDYQYVTYGGGTPR